MIDFNKLWDSILRGLGLRFSLAVDVRVPEEHLDSATRAIVEAAKANGWSVSAQEVVARSAREATIAQKNVRLASIARERDRLIKRIKTLKGWKKKASHLEAELTRLTTLELQIVNGKEPSMAMRGGV